MKKPLHKVIMPILSVILLALVVGYMYAVIKTEDFQKKSDGLQADIESNSIIIRNSSEKTDQKKAEEEAADLGSLGNFFVTEGQEFTLIETVEKICSDSGVKCSIQPVGIDAAEGLPPEFKSLHIIVSGAGTFSNLYKLTSVLERLPYRGTISRVSLQADAENPDVKSGGKAWREDFDFEITTSPK